MSVIRRAAVVVATVGVSLVALQGPVQADTSWGYRIVPDQPQPADTSWGYEILPGPVPADTSWGY